MNQKYLICKHGCDKKYEKSDPNAGFRLKCHEQRCPKNADRDLRLVGGGGKRQLKTTTKGVIGTAPLQNKGKRQYNKTSPKWGNGKSKVSVNTNQIEQLIDNILAVHQQQNFCYHCSAPIGAMRMDRDVLRNIVVTSIQ